MNVEKILDLREGKKAVALLGMLALGSGLAFGGAYADDTQIDPSIALGSLTGKRVLVSPYWLDNFGTANTSWIVRLLEPYGIKVDVVDPNGSSSKQLDGIQTAIASQNYDVIIWQPVDPETAPATIRKIQDGKIGQVLQFASSGLGGLNYSTASIDWTTVYVEPGKAAATFIKAHPELGPPKVAWIGPQPEARICQDRFKGFIDGVKSISPDAEVVFHGAATTQENTRSKMTDFLTQDIPFNIYAGCGGSYSLGGIAAINAAGLGGATDKVPQHVYMVSLDASPPELEFLWNKDSSLMRSGLFGPKTAAISDATMVLDMLTGKVSYDEAADASVSVTWLTPNCEKDRQAALDQFQGVAGFTVPECSFSYSGND